MHEHEEIETLVARLEDLNERLFDLSQEAADARAEADRWREQLGIAERLVAVARDALYAAREMRAARQTGGAMGDPGFWRDVARHPLLERLFERALVLIDDPDAVVDRYVSIDDVIHFLYGRDAERLADRDARHRLAVALQAGAFVR